SAICLTYRRFNPFQMFWLQLFKYSCISAISFNGWKIVGLIAFYNPGFQSMYWGVLIITTIIQIGLTSPDAQEAVALKCRSTRPNIAIANTLIFLSCLFAVITTVLEAL
ncbi:MAG: hypothetical protein AAFO04_05425, partial [Cyanobacteria bacterium J06592_8]